jgi:hypothetical protein
MKKMKMLTISMTLMLFPLLFLSITVTEGQTIDKPTIICTTSAIGNLVEEYLGDAADVLVLVPASKCPADFDMKPGYIDAVSKAKILFKQNIPGEFWLEGLIQAAGNENLTVVSISGAYNTPQGAKNYIREVGGYLSQILKVDLDLKISVLLNDIDEVSSWMINQAETLNTSNVKVISMNWLKKFIESAGFTVVATYNPPETLSIGDITALLETAQTEGVALIVDNLQIDVEFGAGIASQVGAEHLILTNFPGAIPGTETLPKMLGYNAEQLFNGTITWQSKSVLKSEINDLNNKVTLFQITTSLAIIVALFEAVLFYSKKKNNRVH